MMRIANKKILLTAIGILILLVAAPSISFFSPQHQAVAQSDETLTASDQGSNSNSTNSTNSTNAANETTSSTTPSSTTSPTNTASSVNATAQKLASQFIDDLTSGKTKANVLTVAKQRGVQTIAQARDTANLGLYNFTEGGLQLKLPDYASGGNDTAKLFSPGTLVLTFQNLTIGRPDVVNLYAISHNANLMTKLGTSSGRVLTFAIPSNATLPAGTYGLLFDAHFPDLKQDVLLGTTGETVTLPRVASTR
jgi:hypothetical protein